LKQNRRSNAEVMTVTVVGGFVTFQLLSFGALSFTQLVQPIKMAKLKL
jgi:hypothetical protein